MEKTEEEKQIIHLYVDKKVSLGSLWNLYGIGKGKASAVLNKYGLMKKRNRPFESLLDK